MQRGGSRKDARRGPGLTTSRQAIGAVVAAGGLGRRNEGPLPKQFLALGDAPLFVWSVRSLLAFGCEPVVLVVPPDRISFARDHVPAASVEVIGGGETRQQSVANGLAAVDAAVVLVHDAARPFVEAAVMSSLLGALADADAAVPVVSVSETVKRVDNERVLQTVDRKDLVLAQTPQAFKTDVLKDAHERAASEGFVATDDAQLVERYGGAVATVKGSRRNIKITFPEDFELAERLMRS